MINTSHVYHTVVYE